MTAYHPGLTAPPDWALRETAAGRELCCTRYPGRGRLAAWLWIGVLWAVCGYGTAVTLFGWWSGEEIRSGGVLLVVLQSAALVAGFYLATAMFRTTRYRLGKRALAITASQPVVGESTEEIERQNIRAVIRLHGVPRPGHEYDTWRTLLAVEVPGTDETETVPLAADQPDDSAWLAAQIADWAGVDVRDEDDESD